MPLIPHKQHYFDGVRLQLTTGFDAEWIPAMWKVPLHRGGQADLLNSLPAKKTVPLLSQRDRR